jgi:hypothetical protein
MDPTGALAEIRAMIADFQQGTVPDHRLVDVLDGLDRWLTRGGFLPDQWTMPDNYPLEEPFHFGVAAMVTDPAEVLEEIRSCETAFGEQRRKLVELVAGLDRWIITHPGKLPAQWTANRP